MSFSLSVLVAGCGGQSVGSGILKALRLQGGYRLVAADMNPNCAELLQADAGYCIPPASSPEYPGVLLDLCDKEDIRAIFAGSTPDNLRLSQLSRDFSLAGLEVIGCDWGIVQMAEDKLKCSQFLRQKGLAVPDFEPQERAHALLDRVGWPLVLKPRSGNGSRNVHVIDNLPELELLLQLAKLRNQPSLVQEYVGSPDEEYTVGLLIARSGRLLSATCMRRTLALGFTDMAVTVDSEICVQAAVEAARAFRATGPFNVQMRIHKGQASIFEINPRFSGTTPMRAKLGANGPHLLLQNFLFDLEEAAPPLPTGQLVLRSLQEHYSPATALQNINDLRSHQN